MGQIVDIMGVTNACASTVSGGTGSYGCPFKFQLPDGMILIRKGFYVPAATDFTKAYMLELVQAGTIVPLLDAFNFEPINEDDVLETSNTGVNSLARKGLTSLRFTYKKGIQYEKALEALQSYGVFDVWVVDKDGNVLGVEKNGGFGGFNGGLVLPKAKMWNDGSVSEGKAIEVQLTQPGEFKFMTWIEASQLDFFIPTEIDGINTAVLTFADANGAVPPSNTDVTLKVKVFANDGVTPITGLVLGDFKSSNTVTVVAENSPGYYTLTVSACATGATVTAYLYDVADDYNSVELNDILFSGTVSAVVVA